MGEREGCGGWRRLGYVSYPRSFHLWPRVVFGCNSSADLVSKQKKWSSQWSSQTVLFDAFSCILEAIDTSGKGDC